MKSVWTWEVKSQTSARADLAILNAIEGGDGNWTGDALACSRSQIKRLIEGGFVRIDGKNVKANASLRAGQTVQINFPAPEPMELIPEERPLELLYEDEHIVVLNKPPGLTVHPSETQKRNTLVHALLHHIKDLSGIGGVLRPGIVHRLDKDTSGSLVITKTDEAHRKLAVSFSKHHIERSYWALCYGAPKESKPIRIETTLGRNPKDRKKITTGVKGGRKAVTWAHKIKEYSESGNSFASLVEAKLETGRTHQVRVHLTSIGHSILGDPVYGTPTSKQSKWLLLPEDVRECVRRLPGQALHARVLGFEHPITGKKLRFEAEPPAAFRDLMECLKKYTQ